MQIEQLIASHLLWIRKNPVPMMSIGAHENSPFKWNGFLIGPKDTPYSGFTFKFEIRFPKDYPENPPQVFFTENIPPHMNINEWGRVCNDALNDRNGWESCGKNLRVVLANIFSMFSDPNPDSPYD